MSIVKNTKQKLDKLMWRPLAPQPSAAYAAAAGPTQSSFACDLRGRGYADPNLFMLASSGAVFQSYNTITNGWKAVGFSAAVGGSINTGSGWQFVPSQGPSGTIAAGATTTSVVLSTALPASVQENQLANRGDLKGYIIRIVDNAAGASGKIEERSIVGNTSGTTPIIYLNEALSFTPTNGSRYELLSGALYILSTGASKEWRRHDVATGFTSAALSTTNLPATVLAAYTDIITLDEQHVPSSRFPGEGFVVGASTYDTGAAGAWVKSCLLATSSAAGTLTGQASAGDAAVTANQFRNFQIRIVEDATIPTAVGQRRRITSHTSGASPVYTLASNWTVTPSTTCKYVIENDNDKIIFLTSATTIYNYNITANTWDTSTWAARGTAAANGMGSFQLFGIIDTNALAKNSMIFSMRGTATGNNPVDVLDIAAGATGVWTSFALTPNFNTTNIVPSTGCGCVYDPISNGGNFIYFSGPWSAVNGPIQVFRIDVKTRIMQGITPIPIIGGSSTDGVNNKLALSVLIEGSDKISFLYARRPGTMTGELYECALIV